MKIKSGYVLREVAGNSVVVAIGENAVNFNALITLNETGTFLWKQLEAGADEAVLIAAVLSEYETDEGSARRDISEFVEKLRAAELLEEE